MINHLRMERHQMRFVAADAALTSVQHWHRWNIGVPCDRLRVELDENTGTQKS
jgi:hypothetical protein